jgi:hypothetical protein
MGNRTTSMVEHFADVSDPRIVIDTATRSQRTIYSCQDANGHKSGTTNKVTIKSMIVRGSPTLT